MGSSMLKVQPEYPYLPYFMSCHQAENAATMIMSIPCYEEVDSIVGVLEDGCDQIIEVPKFELNMDFIIGLLYHWTSLDLGVTCVKGYRIHDYHPDHDHDYVRIPSDYSDSIYNQTEMRYLQITYSSHHAHIQNWTAGTPLSYYCRSEIWSLGVHLTVKSGG